MELRPHRRGGRPRACHEPVGPRRLSGGARDLPVDEVAEVVELAALGRFLDNPSRFYCEDGLGIRLPESPDRQVGGPPRRARRPRELEPDLPAAGGRTARQADDGRPGRGTVARPPPGRRARRRCLCSRAGDRDVHSPGSAVHWWTTQVGAPLPVAVELDDGTVIVGSVDVVRDHLLPRRGRRLAQQGEGRRRSAVLARPVGPDRNGTGGHMDGHEGAVREAQDPGKPGKVRRRQLRLDAADRAPGPRRPGHAHAPWSTRPAALLPDDVPRGRARGRRRTTTHSSRTQAWAAAVKRWDPAAYGHERTDRFVQHLYDGWSLPDLLALGGDDGDGDCPGLLEALAAAIWGRFEATTEAIS